ncbi:MAG: glycosyltransferase family 2 protein [Dorea sp.]|jgi:glycosyltransferase involved in cell wall biosynthesis|nr:glycosyltransferase family 2 protein [Dorea sp.]MCI9247613.1 glycosyltransferase family 2 protein [Dorea sp.]
MLYSIIIPCYKSSKTIRKVVTLTMEEMERLGRTPYEFVLVDDFSPDGGETVAELESLADEYPAVKIVELAKNSGQHNAVMAGLNHASGDALIAMDDDMQTHPSQLPVLFDEFDKGHDIVYGYYPQKKHSLFRNFGSYVNYLSVRILIGKPKDMKTSSFWIIRKFVRDYVIQYKSQYTHLQGLFLRTTRNISCVPVRHFEREVGSSNYTFKKLVGLWSNIMGYSIVPLRLATYCGYLFSILGILGAAFTVARKLLHPSMAIGWPSMMAAICFFAGVNLLFLGLIGEYLGRMFLGMSRYPQFVVRKVYAQEIHMDKKENIHSDTQNDKTAPEPDIR